MRSLGITDQQGPKDEQPDEVAESGCAVAINVCIDAAPGGKHFKDVTKIGDAIAVHIRRTIIATDDFFHTEVIDPCFRDGVVGASADWKATMTSAGSTQSPTRNETVSHAELVPVVAKVVVGECGTVVTGDQGPKEISSRCLHLSSRTTEQRTR